MRDRQTARFLTRLLLGAVAALAVSQYAMPAEPAFRAADVPLVSLVSGPEVGSHVPSFYTRVVSGPLMNKSVCYVCRNGQRPVVAVFVRSFEPKLKLLLRNIDRVVDLNRAIGLRGFCVKLSDDPFRSISAAQTFSFDNKIVMPLTVASNAVALAGCQNIHSDAAVTVVLYRKRSVENSFAFRAGEMSTDQVRTVIEELKRFARATSGEERMAKVK